MNRMKLEEDIQGCLQVMQSMDTMYEEYARKHGLTYMSLYILETVYEQGGCTQKRISEITLYPKQTVNMVIRSFLEKGWVTLEPDKSDRRSKCIRLTRDGEVFAKQVIEPYWAAASDAFGALEDDARGVMVQALRAFSRSLTEKVGAL